MSTLVIITTEGGSQFRVLAREGLVPLLKSFFGGGIESLNQVKKYGFGYQVRQEGIIITPNPKR